MCLQALLADELEGEAVPRPFLYDRSPTGLKPHASVMCTRCRVLPQALLADELPALDAYLDRNGPVFPAMYVTPWFNTLFAYCVPFGHLMRIWDCFMSEGVKVSGGGGCVRACECVSMRGSWRHSKPCLEGSHACRRSMARP